MIEKQARMPLKIEFHADDYGLFPAQSERILDCWEHGVLNGVSVMPNSPFLQTAMERLYAAKREMAVTVHLNIIEGKSLCSAGEVPLLVDEKGVFRVSFGGLLLHSFLPGRKRYREQLKKEILAQIQAVMQYLPEGTPLRLDGHAHYHMVPVMFDALMDVLKEEAWQISYIRMPREHLSLYLRRLGKLQDISPINFAKVIILNLLARRNDHKYGFFLRNLEQRLFLGVFLSGRMTLPNVSAILPDAMELAKRNHMDMELLSHPGGVFEDADIEKLTSKDDLHFLTCSFRNKEGIMLKEIHKENLQ